MLGPDDPLPWRPRRVLVAGVSGVGKTTLAAEVAAVLGVPHVEIDGLFHGNGWVPRPEFLDDVRALAGSAGWATEWQYEPARPVLLERAEVLIWLDLPFATVTLPRVVRRTLRRRLRHEVLWNGNTEPPLRTILTDPDHIVRWAVRTRHRTRARVLPLAQREGLVIVRLRRPRDVRRWLAGPLCDAATEPLPRD